MKDRKKYGEISGRLSAPVLKELYLSEEKSLQEIADSFGCTRQMVDLLMVKYGISRRERISAVKLAGRKGKFCGAARNRKAAVPRSPEKRGELRAHYPYAVEYTVDPGLSDESFRAMCSDISSSGVCLYVCNGLEAGQKITFRSEVPAFHGEARVRWCSRVGGNVYRAGLIFSETGETSTTIRDLIHSNFSSVTL